MRTTENTRKYFIAKGRSLEIVREFQGRMAAVRKEINTRAPTSRLVLSCPPTPNP